MDPRKLVKEAPEQILSQYIGDIWVTYHKGKAGGKIRTIGKVEEWYRIRHFPVFGMRGLLGGRYECTVRNIIRPWGSPADRERAITLLVANAPLCADLMPLYQAASELGAQLEWAQVRWLPWTAANLAAMLDDPGTPESVRFRQVMHDSHK